MEGAGSLKLPPRQTDDAVLPNAAKTSWPVVHSWLHGTPPANRPNSRRQQAQDGIKEVRWGSDQWGRQANERGEARPPCWEWEEVWGPWVWVLQVRAARASLREYLLYRWLDSGSQERDQLYWACQDAIRVAKSIESQIGKTRKSLTRHIILCSTKEIQLDWRGSKWCQHGYCWDSFRSEPSQAKNREPNAFNKDRGAEVSARDTAWILSEAANWWLIVFPQKETET